MSLISQLTHGQQPEGGLVAYMKRHVTPGVADQVASGIDEARIEIEAALHKLLGADSQTALKAEVELLADGVLNGAAALVQAYIKSPPAA